MLRIWTAQGFDLFFLWRWMLAVVGAVYTALKTIQSISRWLDWFEARDRLSRIRTHYVVLHLLRIRLGSFWWELLQIVLLAVILILIIRMHYFL